PAWALQLAGVGALTAARPWSFPTAPGSPGFSGSGGVEVVAAGRAMALRPQTRTRWAAASSPARAWPEPGARVLQVPRASNRVKVRCLRARQHLALPSLTEGCPTPQGQAEGPPWCGRPTSAESLCSSTLFYSGPAPRVRTGPTKKLPGSGPRSGQCCGHLEVRPHLAPAGVGALPETLDDAAADREPLRVGDLPEPGAGRPVDARKGPSRLAP